MVYRSIHDGFRWSVPARFNYAVDVVDRWAEDPDRLALIWCDAAGRERHFTFAEIGRLSCRLANALRRRGIGKGDRVMVMLPRIPEWQVAIVALARIGAVAAPCITMLTASDVAYRVNDAGITAAITTRDNTGKFAGLDGITCRLSVGGTGDAWDDFDAALAAEAETCAAAEIAIEDPAVIYYTSGSTGRPKGVTHAARGLYAWRVSAKYWLTLAPGEVMFCTADTGWSKAGTSILYGPWSEGATVLFHDGPFDPARRIALLEKYRVTVFCAAATEFRRLIGLDLAGADLSALRLTVSAGESVNPEIVARWRALTGQPVVEAYGQTEALMLVANYPGTEIRPGSMGRPLPGTGIAVLDADLRPVGPGVAGQLAIRLPNPQMMLGYWNDPERTGAVFATVDGTRFYLTGDNVRADADGYLYYVGRSDDVINSAGYRIGPTEVENALMEHPAVQESAAVASPDLERGEVVKAFIVLNRGYVPGDDLVRDIQEHVKRVTAPYKYPRRIAFVDDLPKDVVGKIRRRELRDREFAGRPRSGPQAPAGSG